MNITWLMFLNFNPYHICFLLISLSFSSTFYLSFSTFFFSVLISISISISTHFLPLCLNLISISISFLSLCLYLPLYPSLSLDAFSYRNILIYRSLFLFHCPLLYGFDPPNVWMLYRYFLSNVSHIVPIFLFSIPIYFRSAEKIKI